MGFSQPAGELNRLTYMVSSKRSTQVHFEDINYAVVLKSKNKKDKSTKKQEDIANTGNWCRKQPKLHTVSLTAVPRRLNNQSQPSNRLPLWARAFLSPSVSSPSLSFALTSFHLCCLLNRNTIVPSTPNNACCFFYWLAQKHTLAHFCLFCLLEIPVTDLVTRPISKSGFVNDGPERVTMSSGPRTR